MHRLLLYDTNRNIIGLRFLFSAADESDLKLQNKKFREESSETKVTVAAEEKIKRIFQREGLLL